MPRAVRLGDNCSGHGCFPPRPTNSASDTVLINNRGAHRLGDSLASHCCKTCHTGTTIGGSSTVFINNRPAARVGDQVTCGSVLQEASDNVEIGG